MVCVLHTFANENSPKRKHYNVFVVTTHKKSIKEKKGRGHSVVNDGARDRKGRRMPWSVSEGDMAASLEAADTALP